MSVVGYSTTFASPVRARVQYPDDEDTEQSEPVIGAIAKLLRSEGRIEAPRAPTKPTGGAGQGAGAGLSGKAEAATPYFTDARQFDQTKGEWTLGDAAAFPKKHGRERQPRGASRRHDSGGPRDREHRQDQRGGHGRTPQPPVPPMGGSQPQRTAVVDNGLVGFYREPIVQQDYPTEKRGRRKGGRGRRR